MSESFESFQNSHAPLSSNTLSDNEYRKSLDRLDRFSYWTDSNIRLPFTSFRFGLSPLIGLIPGIGDFAGLILSLYVLHEARKVGAHSQVKRKMIWNMLLEFTVGLIPIVGDAFDAVFKANTRNTKLLRNYLYNELGKETEQRFPWLTFAWVTILILILVWAILWWVW